MDEKVLQIRCRKYQHKLSIIWQSLWILPFLILNNSTEKTRQAGKF